MGDELTGVTLGGFGGRSPHPLLFFFFFLLLSPSVSFLLGLSPLAIGSFSCGSSGGGGGGGKRSKNSAWCFSEQVPPAATPNNGNYRHHLRLKQASLRPEGLA